MSAANGGRGAPPVPPEGHGPPDRGQQVPITKEITHISQATVAERHEHGAILVFVVMDGGQLVKHNYLVGAEEKSALVEQLTGGLKIP